MYLRETYGGEGVNELNYGKLFNIALLGIHKVQTQACANIIT